MCHMNSWLYNILVHNAVINSISNFSFKKRWPKTGTKQEFVKNSSRYKLSLPDSWPPFLACRGQLCVKGQVVSCAHGANSYLLKPDMEATDLYQSLVWWQETPKLTAGIQNLHLKWILLGSWMKIHEITLSFHQRFLYLNDYKF